MGSLRFRIGLLWAVLAAVCATMLAILVAADRAGPAAQIARAAEQTRASCAAIRSAIERLVPASDDGTSPLMEVVVDLSLREAYGVEGGIWSRARGFTTYAYPTYEGKVRKTDVPAAETASIAALARSIGVACLVFDDGRQVFVPPHLGARLAALVRPGQQARIGPPAESARGPASLRTITAVASGATLAETPADAARPPPTAERGSRALHAARAAGTIRLRLHGPRGETNGLLLDSGTEVFFPPHVANEAGAWLWPGRPITVEGYGQTSSYGTVLQATTIVGPSGQTVAVFGAPR